MRAVLFNLADIRLGEVSVPDDCRLINFGGGLFVKTGNETKLDGEGYGVAFDMAEEHVLTKLHTFNPRRR